VNFTGISIYRIEGGKIAESWGVSDLLSMMQQLGAVGGPGEAQGA
jgi:predicted ester cyclase